ncbi:MAG: CoA ester lyase [Actinomycetota bacterium]|nr:CoA ester lyase [Actinomycetota bacterium]
MTRAVPEPNRPNRLRRSCLAVPASNERALAKAPTLAVDMILVDLEDSVPAARKNDETRARAAVCLAASGSLTSTLALRVNAVSTGWWADDVRVVLEEAGERLHCIVVPKVEAVEEVRQVDRLLSRLEASLGLATRVGIEAQIESARGLVEIERIAAASDRLETLVFGPGDYAASLGIVQRSIGEFDPAYPGDQWHYARSRIAAVAHAFGLQPIDGPYAAIDDVDGLRESARRARLVGFQGKWAVHPAQIEPLNEVFSPSDEEVEHAVGTLAALDEASEHGAALVDGAMVDEASRRLAEAVVRRARAVGMDV